MKFRAVVHLFIYIFFFASLTLPSVNLKSEAFVATRENCVRVLHTSVFVQHIGLHRCKYNVSVWRYRHCLIYSVLCPPLTICLRLNQSRLLCLYHSNIHWAISTIHILVSNMHWVTSCFLTCRRFWYMDPPPMPSITQVCGVTLGLILYRFERILPTLSDFKSSSVLSSVPQILQSILLIRSVSYPLQYVT